MKLIENNKLKTNFEFPQNKGRNLSIGTLVLVTTMDSLTLEGFSLLAMGQEVMGNLPTVTVGKNKTDINSASPYWKYKKRFGHCFSNSHMPENKNCFW